MSSGLEETAFAILTACIIFQAQIYGSSRIEDCGQPTNMTLAEG